MTEAEKAVKDAVGKEVVEFTKTLEGYATTKGMETAFEEFGSKMTAKYNDTVEALASLKGVVERQSIKIEEQKSGGTPEGAFSKMYKNFYDEKLKQHDNKSGSFLQSLSVKTDVVRAAAVNNPAAVIESGVNRTALRKIRMWDLIRNKVTMGAGVNATYGYWEENVTTRAAAAIAENGDYGESETAWVYRTMQLEKVGDSIPVTWEMLRDVTWVESELRIFLDVNVALIVDSYILKGTGATPQTKGLNVYASEFTDAIAGDYEVASPSIWDVARAMKTKIETGKDDKYSADVVVMNSADFFTATSAKDTLGQPIRPAFVSDDFMTVNGMQVFVSSIQPVGSLTVFCNDQVRIIHDGLTTMEVGENTGDFIADRQTLKARRRFNLLIKTLDVTSIYITDDVDATIAAMTPTP